MKNKDKGMDLMEHVKNDIERYGVVDSEPRMVGRNIGMHVVPISRK